MITIEDRVRAAARAAADTVPPGSIPPLRLPAERARFRRRRRRGERSLARRAGWLRAVVPVAAAASVLAVIAASLAISRGASDSDDMNLPALNSPAGCASAALLTSCAIIAMTTVPVAALDKVRAGGASATTLSRITAPPLMSDGKPEVLSIGAEWCSYCAAESWALVVALNRFGSFSRLHEVSSGKSGDFPDTPGISFYRSSYTSKYLTFAGVETQTVAHKKLQPLDPQQNAIFNKYDYPPYYDEPSAGAIPFIDLGGTYMVNGAQYVPEALNSPSWQAFAAQLRAPSSLAGLNVDGAANLLTAAICLLTGNQPGSVCDTSMIQNLERQLH